MGRPRTRAALGCLSSLEDAANEVYVSAVSAWEISIKQSLGKLELDQPPPVVGPLWELAIGEVNGQPVAGLKGVGIEVVLPNGQIITIPVIVIPPLGPGRGTDPQKLWQLISERDRARLVSSALTQISGELQDDTSKHILERASAQLIHHASRPGGNR